MADTTDAKQVGKKNVDEKGAEDLRIALQEFQNGKETTERLREYSTACRRLDFGTQNSVDDQLNDFVQFSSEDMHNQRQKAIEKWNFDFENEVPLEGDWEWERVAPVQPTETKEVICNMEKKTTENRTI